MARNRMWLRLKSATLTCLCLAFAASGCESRPGSTDQPSGNSSPHVVAASAVEAGRYLVIVAGCNDCHTDGYMTSGDAVPEEAWLSGSRLGWRGPWGTTYAANLRLRVQELSEEDWVTMLRTRRALPPHPWVNTNQLSDSDARAMYQYIRSLGPVGEPMPASVAPDRAPSTAYLSMIPVEPPKE
jgi:mono/diheme cytochrome c family protein